MKRTIYYLALIVLSAFLLPACSKDDEPKLSKEEQELIGAWENDTEYGFVFCKDHTGYVFTYDPNKVVVRFSWEIKKKIENAVYFKIDFQDKNLSWGPSLEGALDYETSTLNIFTLCSLRGNYTAVDGFTENDEGDDNKGNNDKNDDSAKQLIGNWFYSPSNSKSIDYYFYENGTGYCDESKIISDDIGICRTWYKWTAKNGVLTLKRESASEQTFNYETDGKTLTLTTSSGKSTTYRYYAVSYTLPYGEIPYKNSYIYYKTTDTYYMISMVKEFCQHAASSGDKTNWKFVQFFGENETLKPTGLYCYYTTPYYEGIDGTWSSGTYIMLGNGGTGFYKYGCVCTIGGNQPDLSTKDKLVIKKDSYKYVYDYYGEDVRLHVEATKIN